MHSEALVARYGRMFESLTELKVRLLQIGVGEAWDWDLNDDVNLQIDSISGACAACLACPRPCILSASGTGNCMSGVWT